MNGVDGELYFIWWYYNTVNTKVTTDAVYFGEYYAEIKSDYACIFPLTATVSLRCFSC